MNLTSRKGMRYEERPREYLQDRGLRLLEQNYHSRFGEIDLIMLERDILCFIEVKFRGSGAYGGAMDALPLSKQRKIVKTALFYLCAHRHRANQPMRFDALLIQRKADGGDGIDWIKNAFYAE